MKNTDFAKQLLDWNRTVFDSYWRLLMKRGETPGSTRFIELLGGKEALLAFEKRWRKWVISLEFDDMPSEASKKALKLEKTESE